MNREAGLVDVDPAEDDTLENVAPENVAAEGGAAENVAFPEPEAVEDSGQAN